MNQKALNALEYPKIIEKLTEKASSYMGKQLCKNLEPSTDLETIRLMQVQTKDALTRLFQKGSISFGNVKDIRGSLKRLEIGSALSIQEILAVCGLLENTSRVKTYSRKERNDLPGDSLDSMFDGLSPLTPLSTEIRRCILSEEEISDDASPALRQIRRNMKITNDRIHTQLGRAGKRQCPHLSTGLCHHYAKWQILHSCQSRIQRAGSRYDPRSVFYRLYTFYRTNVRSQVKQ